MKIQIIGDNSGLSCEVCLKGSNHNTSTPTRICEIRLRAAWRLTTMEYGISPRILLVEATQNHTLHL